MRMLSPALSPITLRFWQWTSARTKLPQNFKAVLVQYPI